MYGKFLSAQAQRDILNLIKSDPATLDLLWLGIPIKNIPPWGTYQQAKKATIHDLIDYMMALKRAIGSNYV
jgi:hypothetical protein